MLDFSPWSASFTKSKTKTLLADGLWTLKQCYKYSTKLEYVFKFSFALFFSTKLNNSWRKYPVISPANYSPYCKFSNSKFWNPPDCEVFNWTFAPPEVSTKSFSFFPRKKPFVTFMWNYEKCSSCTACHSISPSKNTLGPIVLIIIYTVRSDEMKWFVSLTLALAGLL